MHEEVVTTTSTISKFSNNTVVNSTTALHQSNEDGTSTITVSIIHPNQQNAEIGDFIAASELQNNPCSTIINQIVPTNSKIIISTNELETLKDDISSVIINGTISNSNDPNVLILPTTETCDSDKNPLGLSHLESSQVDQVQMDLQEINSPNEETSSREEEIENFHSMLNDFAKSVNISAVAVAVQQEV